ncbi:MAG: hypothetical protein CMJ76_01610 [Planctomycetaceae bacterium]|nr:hypothetical protein [Planctomycetaceae bacterium]
MQSLKRKRRPVTKPQRRGFTLFEIMVVLVVVVVLGSIAYPTIAGMTGVESLLRSGDQVRIHLARSRNQAMRSGQTLSMRYELQGNRYIIEPWSTGEEFIEIGATPDSQQLVNVLGIASADALNESEFRTVKKLLGYPHRLQDGIQFVGSIVEFDARSAILGDPQLNDLTTAAGQTSMTDSIQGLWSDPILFYPDGSTSQTEIRLGSSDGKGFIMVRLRGLTGIAYVTNVASAEEVRQLDLQRLGNQ